MNDIFYFSPEKVDLKDVQSELSKHGSYIMLLNKNGDALEVNLGDEERLQFSLMDIRNDFGDAEDVDVINSTQVVSAFCISHHNYSLKKVIIILRLLLGKYKGWVGNDSEAFEPRYTLDNVESFNYQ